MEYKNVAIFSSCHSRVKKFSVNDSFTGENLKVQLSIYDLMFGSSEIPFLSKSIDELIRLSNLEKCLNV